MRRPVAIMFHSVGMEDYRWSYPHISEPPDHFARKMEALVDAGYSTAFFVDPPAARNGRKQAVLTFDDGYLDNWVHVFPVLERFGLKATIFVTPEFVDPRDVVRPRVSPAPDADDHDAATCCAGFLSWSELRAMEASGLVDVQCHGLTHTWYFSGSEIVDFWHPGAATSPMGPVWMLWNRSPELKPHYLTRAAERETDLPYGTPIYVHGKALETRRYFPDDGLDAALPRYVAEHGGAELFRESDWRERLRAVAESAAPAAERAAAGRFETDAQYLDRVRDELTRSKAILEERLGKSIEGICWPGGGVNEDVLRLARECGYRRFTLPSAWRAAQADGRYGDLTPRIGSRSRIFWHGRDLGRATAREFVWDVESSQSPTHRWLNRAAVAARLGMSLMGRWSR